MNATGPIVIIGAGQAGGWAAKTLRDIGYVGRIVLLADEQHPPHERPPLSKAVLAGRAAPDTTHLFKPPVQAALALDWRPGARAVAIDRAARRVALADGSAIEYERLILCMGGRARLPGFERSATVPVHTLRSIDDAIALRAALESARRLLVVGGGWIGLEVAATARTLGLHVRIVEYAPRICARVLPPEISALLRDLHVRHGVEITEGRSVSRIEAGAGGALLATLDDGSAVEADCVVAGIGLMPNDELARQSGLACDGGVIVDARCMTSDPAIFAAGDVAVAPNASAGRSVRLESWQNAQDQGIAAARAAYGLDVRYDPLPKFFSDQYDVNIQMLGWIHADQRVAIRGDVRSDKFVAFALDEGRVRAAIAFNAAREMRGARRLIESNRGIDPNRLVDAAVDLAKL